MARDKGVDLGIEMRGQQDTRRARDSRHKIAYAEQVTRGDQGTRRSADFQQEQF